MSWVQRTLSSSLGSKYLVAITGLGMVGFLVAHLAGNLLVFAGPDAINAYAEGLRTYPQILLVARIGLIVMAVAHIGFAVRLNLKNKAARPIAYAKKTYVKASLPSRTMALTGLLVLSYILFHLAHFTFRVTSEQIGTYAPFDVYNMIVASFSDPLVAGTYILSMIVMGFHLSHGVSSVFQTFGLNHDKYNPVIRALGPLTGIVLAALFISIPVAVMLGIVK